MRNGLIQWMYTLLTTVEMGNKRRYSETQLIGEIIKSGNIFLDKLDFSQGRETHQI